MILKYLSEMDVTIWCALRYGKQSPECECPVLENIYVNQDVPDLIL